MPVSCWPLSIFPKPSEKIPGDTFVLFNNFLFFPKGGFDDNSPLSSVERFDPRTHRWEYVSELTTPRGGVGVATVMGRVFAVGGHNGNIYLNTVEAFEPRMNRWGGDGWGPCDVVCLEVIKVGSKLQVFGDNCLSIDVTYSVQFKMLKSTSTQKKFIHIWTSLKCILNVILINYT